MKYRYCVLFFTVLFASHGFGQVTFDSGYIIDNNGKRTECLIRNLDWKNNPVEFKYKLAEYSETIIGKLVDFKELVLYKGAVFKKFNVAIDRSPDFTPQSVDDMSQERNPIFRNEVLYLRLLLDGEVDLYFYEDNNLRRFFYARGSDIPAQLVYKGFRIIGSGVSENNEFRQQLFNELKCDAIKPDDINDIGYKRKELLTLFKKYNECSGFSYLMPKDKREGQDLFNLSIRPGMNYSSLTFLERGSFLPTREIVFRNSLGFRIGIESEFILNFNKNKWSIIFEPSYQSYTSDF